MLTGAPRRQHGVQTALRIVDAETPCQTMTENRQVEVWGPMQVANKKRSRAHVAHAAHASPAPGQPSPEKARRGARTVPTLPASSSTEVPARCEAAAATRMGADDMRPSDGCPSAQETGRDGPNSKSSDGTPDVPDSARNATEGVASAPRIVFFKLPDNSTAAMDMRHFEHATISDVMDWLGRLTGTAPACLHLAYQGKPLTQQSTLASYNIQVGATMFVLVQRLGGMLTRSWASATAGLTSSEGRASKTHTDPSASAAARPSTPHDGTSKTAKAVASMTPNGAKVHCSSPVSVQQGFPRSCKKLHPLPIQAALRPSRRQEAQPLQKRTPPTASALHDDVVSTQGPRDAQPAAAAPGAGDPTVTAPDVAPGSPAADGMFAPLPGEASPPQRSHPQRQHESPGCTPSTDAHFANTSATPTPNHARRSGTPADVSQTVVPPVPRRRTPTLKAVEACASLLPDTDGGTPKAHSEEFLVDHIRAQRVCDGRLQYQVRWVGYNDCTWESHANLLGTEALRLFNDQPTRGEQQRGGVTAMVHRQRPRTGWPLPRERAERAATRSPRVENAAPCRLMTMTVQLKQKPSQRRWFVWPLPRERAATHTARLESSPSRRRVAQNMQKHAHQMRAVRSAPVQLE